MGKDEAIKQLDAMESEAKKLIDAGQEKSSFMFDIADAATKMAVQNLELADFIIAGAQTRIINISKYQSN